MAGAADAIADPAIDRLVVTDAVPPFRLSGDGVRSKIDILRCAPLLAETIRRLEAGESLSDLLVF
jgi:ribose-phosphate pyrophosphokinase